MATRIGHCFKLLPAHVKTQEDRESWNEAQAMKRNARRTSADPHSHLRPKRVAVGDAGSGGPVLGFELPGKKITTYRISVDDAFHLFAELPKAIEQGHAPLR
jgi:hypothetical protein